MPSVAWLQLPGVAVVGPDEGGPIETVLKQGPHQAKLGRHLPARLQLAAPRGAVAFALSPHVVHHHLGGEERTERLAWRRCFLGTRQAIIELSVGWHYGNTKGWCKQPSEPWSCKVSEVSPCCCAQCHPWPTRCPFPSWQYQLAFPLQQGIGTKRRG